jgi:hypothetical protein
MGGPAGREPHLAAVTGAQTASAPLILEAKIPLGQVSDRIDHLGIDVKRRRPDTASCWIKINITA